MVLSVQVRDKLDAERSPGADPFAPPFSVEIFNANFDGRLVAQQTANAFGAPLDWWREVYARCAMFLVSRTLGATNRHGTISLANATKGAGVMWSGRALTAVADTLATERQLNSPDYSSSREDRTPTTDEMVRRA